MFEDTDKLMYKSRMELIWSKSLQEEKDTR